MPAAGAELRKAAELIRRSPSGAIQVIGHTDSKGDDSYNQKLSEARAKTVADWFHRQTADHPTPPPDVRANHSGGGRRKELCGKCDKGGLMKILVVATLVAVTASVPAFAKDRVPTRAERIAIEKKLHSLGYTSWDSIELDDDRPYHEPKWEIDDARKGNGPRYDVDLEPRTLKVIREKQDD